MLQKLTSTAPFVLECGEILPEITIAYHTYGTLNSRKDNVVWVFHPLTGNTEAADWWKGLIGEGKILDPADYFIVCANMLGSCYGATNADSVNPSTGKTYGKNFPLITVRDMVRSHQLLQEYLGIQKIYLGIGGSMGGQQLLEWAIIDPAIFENLVAMATNAQHSPWGIAFNETQRMSLQADPSLYDNHPEAGRKGLEAARAIGMLSYRNETTYNATQSEQNDLKLNGFKAASYQNYQGSKLGNRFSPRAYLTLSKAMDSHHVGRNRGGVANALRQIKANTLIIGIQSDILFPIKEQAELAKHIPDARFKIIDSIYGHDGFLTENELITASIDSFLIKKISKTGGEDNIVNYSTANQILTTALPGTERF